jgi:phage terminase small subunit
MGRHPLPKAIQDAKGYFEKHPDRARPNEPTPTKPLGNAPKYLSDDQKKLWNEFKGKMLPGVVFDSDSWQVERIVKLMDKFRKDTITDAGQAQLTSLLARFGMSPADRAKVTVGGEAPKDELDDYIHKPKPKKPAPPPVPVTEATSAIQ